MNVRRPTPTDKLTMDNDEYDNEIEGSKAETDDEGGDEGEFLNIENDTAGSVLYFELHVCKHSCFQCSIRKPLEKELITRWQCFQKG